MSNALTSLTIDEVAVLGEEFNLADGHAYRPWSTGEAAIVDRAADLFRRADRRDQAAIEQIFFETFFATSRQSWRPDAFDFRLCFTASTALEVIANYLRLQGASVGLIEPCFDNLHDILVRHGIPLIPFDEALMTGDRDVLSAFVASIPVHAIFLVSPNNPTGAQINPGNFRALLAACRDVGKLLILDATFRFYTPCEDIFDAYADLADSGVDCFVIEDTGKTWPTLELKAPFFSVSKNVSETICRIYSDFLLHVSPISVLLVTAFLRLPYAEGLGVTHRLVADNRQRLETTLQGVPLTDQAAPFMSTAWLEISDGLSSSELRDRLANYDLHTLPGRPFYWSQPALGERFLRIALLRDSAMFDRAMQRLQVARRAIWSV